MMDNPLDVAVAALGGPAAFRLALEISPRTLSEWRRFGVPDTRWHAVAQACGHLVTAEHLAAERALKLRKTEDAAA